MNAAPKPPVPKKAAIFSLFCGLGGILSFLLSARLEPIALFQLLSVVLLFFSVRVIIKYLLSRTLFLFREENLLVVQQQGKKEKLLLSVPIDENLRIEKKDRNTKIPKGVIRFSYCRDLFAKDPVLLFFRDGGRELVLACEPEEQILAELTKRIQKKQNEKSGK